MDRGCCTIFRSKKVCFWRITNRERCITVTFGYDMHFESENKAELCLETKDNGKRCALLLSCLVNRSYAVFCTLNKLNQKIHFQEQIHLLHRTNREFFRTNKIAQSGWEINVVKTFNSSASSSFGEFSFEVLIELWSIMSSFYFSVFILLQLLEGCQRTQLTNQIRAYIAYRNKAFLINTKQLSPSQCMR